MSTETNLFFSPDEEGDLQSEGSTERAESKKQEFSAPVLSDSGTDRHWGSYYRSGVNERLVSLPTREGLDQDGVPPVLCVFSTPHSGIPTTRPFLLILITGVATSFCPRTRPYNTRGPRVTRPVGRPVPKRPIMGPFLIPDP